MPWPKKFFNLSRFPAFTAYTLGKFHSILTMFLLSELTFLDIDATDISRGRKGNYNSRLCFLQHKIIQ